MQVLYQKIDEILGKGIGWEIMAELILYASFTLVPLALPLAVLIASIMTMGNLGERYELVAMKSAGVSLTRAMASLILASVVMGLVAFYFSNTVMPYSKLKFNALIWDIKQKKSVLLIREGVFINDFDNMTMRVEEKTDDDALLGVTIYDHRKPGQTRVIKADSARIVESDTSNYLTMHLMSGKMHEDKNLKNAYTRFAFDELDLVVDMSSFALGKTDEDLFKNNASLKTLGQISRDKDSLENSIGNSLSQTKTNLAINFKFIKSHRADFPIRTDSLLNDRAVYDKNVSTRPVMQYTNALSRVKAVKQQLGSQSRSANMTKKELIKHDIAWYQKFALAFSCVILFFIGAPMGALVRKGGFGLPIVISIAFYLLYYIIDIIGRRLAEEQAISPLLGIWLSSILLAPVAIVLTRMALLDRRVNLPKIKNPFKKEV